MGKAVDIKLIRIKEASFEERRFNYIYNGMKDLHAAGLTPLRTRMCRAINSSY